MSSTTPSSKAGRNALGRGLAALIPPTTQTPTAAFGGSKTLPIEKLKPSPDQPRKHFDKAALEELSHSIAEQGILQPVIVCRIDGDYAIVAGERRWRAAQLAGLTDIPVIIKDLTDEARLKIALIENIQREDLDPLEEAQAYAGLMREHGLTQQAVAESVGKNRATVANSLRLLKLPQPVLDFLADGKINAGHARALMTLKEEPQQLRLAKEIATKKLTVRDAESKARQMNKVASKSERVSSQEGGSAEKQVEEQLMRYLGTKVRMVNRRGKGRLEISFHSLDQLDDLLDRIVTQ